MIPDEAVEAGSMTPEKWSRARLLRGVDYLLISGGGSIWRRFKIVRRGKGYAIEETK